MSWLDLSFLKPITSKFTSRTTQVAGPAGVEEPTTHYFSEMDEVKTRFALQPQSSELRVRLESLLSSYDDGFANHELLDDEFASEPILGEKMFEHFVKSTRICGDF